MKTDLQIKSSVLKIDGWLSEIVINKFISIIKTLPENSNILEIGSWKGKSTTLFALASSQESKVYAIDPFSGSQEHHHIFGQEIDTYADFQRNIELNKIENKVIVLKGTTNDFKDSMTVKNINFDFVFIDGSHNYQDVLLDFQIWFPRVKTNGWIAFHDYKWPGVKKVVWDELLKSTRVAKVYRVEDTFYAQKINKYSPISHGFNLLHLSTLKVHQFLKRHKRRIKKKFKKITLIQLVSAFFRE